MDRIVYLIRHAERKEAKKGFVSDSEPITQMGIHLSKNFGSKLHLFHDLAIYTSPVLRCKQTASAIVNGYKKSIPIIENKLFGSPGAYILDPSVAIRSFEKYGNMGVIDQFIQGHALSGFTSLDFGSEKILSFCQSLQTSYSLIITHDSILAFLAAYLFKTNKIKDVLYGYLEGIALKLSNTDKKIISHAYRPLSVSPLTQN